MQFKEGRKLDVGRIHIVFASDNSSSSSIAVDSGSHNTVAAFENSYNQSQCSNKQQTDMREWGGRSHRLWHAFDQGVVAYSMQ